MARNNTRIADTVLLGHLKSVAKHGSMRAAALAEGIPEGTFKSRMRMAQERDLKIDEARVEREKDEEIKYLRKALKDATHEGDTAEKIREQIYKLAGIDADPPKWLVKRDGVKDSGAPVTLWSDWHYGEVVDLEEMSGLNEFGLDIADTRIRRLVEKIVLLAFEHMTSPSYPGIVVCLGGDMISGDIHEELQDTNEDYTLRSMNRLLDMLTWAIEALADNFGHVFVPCVVGNHGRNTRKPRAKGRVFTSLEWNLYVSLARQFRNDDRVAFHIPGEADARFNVMGHRFLLTHGDSLGVRGGDGIIGAIGPITRGTIKVGRLESQVGRDFDTIMMGHWHQRLNLPGIIVNNCLKGYDEYARLFLRAPYSAPSQELFFVRGDGRIGATWEVYLEDDKLVQREEKAPWVIHQGNLTTAS